MPSVALVSPYPTGPSYTWVKGNLHTHTTHSDGRLDIQETIRRYADLGHDFLMISDHDVLADYAGLDPCGLTLLRGNEISASGAHLLDVGGFSLVSPGARQQVINDIGAAGGFAVLCHPNWEDDFNHFPLDRLMRLEGYVGIEIFNGGCLAAPGSAYALNKWDMLLSSGRQVWGYAADDTHKPEQIGRGWNVALVADRSESAVLAALRGGAFYASTGVTVESITCEGPVLTVTAPDAEAIAVMGENGQRLAYEETSRFVFDACDLITPYIRIDCFGRGDRRAWSQPIALKSELIDRLRALLAEKPTFPVGPADRVPEMSGTLSDTLWRQARPVTTFHAQPAAGQPPVGTEVRGLLAEDCLYLGFRCQEPQIDALKLSARQGDLQIWADDSVEIFVADADNPRAYWQIMVNAAGAWASVHTDGRLNLPGLRAVAGRDDAGWTVEVAIPVAETIPRGTARFNVCRNRHPVPCSFSWSWTGRSYHKPESFGQIRLPGED